MSENLSGDFLIHTVTCVAVVRARAVLRMQQKSRNSIRSHRAELGYCAKPRASRAHVCGCSECECSRIGVRDGGQGAHVPPKIRGKYFSGNYYVKFGHFRAKIM